MARILITEDERLIAEDLRLTLLSFGHEVIDVVSTAEESIKIALSLRPDLIFMDRKLDGDLTGLEAAREIRRQNKQPIIFCTAYSDDHTLLSAAALKPSGYINKPFSEADIRKVLSKFNYPLSIQRPNRKDIFSNRFSISDLCLKPA